ncbi:uncharacterized protein GIQ15_00096 [Arthroderma uncinatum]|uniref:uncharacterized protein n=1 Tax=Arthroderma uncinatum TaxID=74035 RepID=UPI00144AA810|nr:uncharacterized protein GIQ15_00096 [Arthroderma uncinatum]KAF3490579.1 integral membrane protein [Arthroderma uncinatum]
MLPDLRPFHPHSAAVLLLFLTSVVGAIPHGDGHGSTEMSGLKETASTMAAAATASAEANDTAHLMSYFRYQKYPGTILAHIILMAIGWAIVLPVVAEVVMGLLLAFSGNKKYAENKIYERTAFLPANTSSNGARPYAQDVGRQHRWSGDSGQGSEVNNFSPRSRCSSFEHDRQDGEDLEIAEVELRDKSAGRWMYPFGSLHTYLMAHFPQLVSRRGLGVLSVIHVIIERTILILGFFALTSGAVVYTGIFRGHQIFNGLAHFIKGGIFIWYGFLTLGRWVGCFADFGWAWNVKPSRALVGGWKSRVPTAEFTESFVIFLYGASNVFLEHLGGWGGPWTAHDLEHVSITIMFFGGGLCGMLAESRRMRDWVNLTALGPPPIFLDKDYPASSDDWRPPRSQGVSLNPMPATHGVNHGAQAVGSILPSRPPSELVTSFCLISGGLIFMLSSSDIVAAMEYYDLNAMIVFTVGMGATALAMAWEIVVISLKAWATKNSAISSPMRREFQFPE